MYPHQPGGQGQQQPPNQWAPQLPNSSQPPPTGVYPPPLAQPPNAIPSLADRSDMAILQQQQPYRLPAPHELYRPPPPPHDPYRQPQMPYPPHQPAPRQRTAIACRYCRRRKIRCSGFEASEDGRCTNCSRFSQECIFTPVSAQTQAFVPAHTVYRGTGQPPPLYGAYGQPLPPPQHAQHDAYGLPQARQPPHQLAAPTGPYSAPQPYSPYPAPNYDDRAGRDSSSRKRPTNEPHTPTLPPPNPASQAQLPAHRGSGPEYEYKYPDPTALTPAAVSPASSSASFHSAPPQQQPVQPYYTTTQPPPRRSSPQSTYSYEPSRASSSPHTQGAPGTPSTVTYPYSSDGALRPPTTNLPIRADGRTPPPTSAGGTSQAGTRMGMSISSIMSDNARSAADADMLNRLR